MKKEYNQLSGYELSKNFFDWAFENPEKVAPGHVAVFFFSIEHYNRMGWKEKFGFPSQMVMDAVGIKKHGTYIKYFNDLVEWGFFILVQKSLNQYSANIISLSNALPKNGKALGKAVAKHGAKHGNSTGQSTGQSKGSIDKLITNNLEPITNNQYFSPASAGAEKKSELIFWKNFVDVWNEWYKTKFNDSYNYMKKDFAHLKKLYLFLEKRASDKKFEFTEENLLAAFKFFLNKAWEKDDWLKNNFSIPNLLSQFNQIANGTNQKNGKQQPGSLRAGVQEAFNRRFAGAGQPGHQPGTETV